jgi:uncharacterized membrane protein
LEGIEQRKLETQQYSASGISRILTALYSVGVAAFAPISFPVFQVRVADALLPLSIFFGAPAVVGLTLGNLLGNALSPFGPIDVIGGTIANFVASFIAWQIGQRRFRGSWFLGTVTETLIITFIVGTYLAFLTSTPLCIFWLGVGLGEVVAINIGGFLLLQVVSRVFGRSSQHNSS